MGHHVLHSVPSVFVRIRNGQTMKVIVQYTCEIGSRTELELSPTETTRTLDKKKMIELSPPPAWANTSLVMHRGTTEYLDNTRTLASCDITVGSFLRLLYARKLSA